MTPHPYACGELIHEAVTRQARDFPERPALVQGRVRLSYRELDAASDDYAAELRSRGVAEGHRVPVLTGRTPQYVALILAVLKCGAAYAALDPRWPEERLRSVVERLQPPVTVLDRALGDLGVPVWRADGLPLDAALRSGRPAPRAVCDGGDEATIFFTSGSTGVPKGVVTPHRATTRLFRPDSFADFGPGHVTAASAALPWDAASMEVWGPLVSGGTVALMEDEYLLPSGLAALVREQGVDTVFLTTSLFHAFVAEDPACFLGIGHVMTGGERLSPRHVRQFLRAHPSVRLTNGYGPVESCVFATTHDVREEDTERPDGIPLGRTVPRTTVHVMRDARLCAPGETGEICIGGDGLATEYLGLPEETADRFVSAEVDGTAVRLYRSGDLGYLSADGLLHFVGRGDRQVKVRGRRIEPQEIENVCHDLPGVQQAVAVPVPGPEGSYTGMVLFYVAEPGEMGTVPDPTAVRARLAAELPDYCVPDQVRRLDTVPLMPNGKTDTASLLASAAAPTEAAANSSAELTKAPGGRWGAVVLDEFRRLLGPGVATDAPLALMGGTSIDAIRLCARLTARTGVTVPVSAFLRRPTVEGLAAWLEERSGSGSEPDSCQPDSHDGVGPHRVQLRGMRAHFSLLHELDPSDSTALCHLVWKVTGPLDPSALEDSLNDVQQRHQALRSRYVLDPVPVAEPPGTVRRTRVQVLAPSGTSERAADAMARELNRPLHIEDAQVWRCVYAPVDDRTAHLGLTIHHIAVDSWSQDLIVADLERAYRARSRGETPQFDDTPPTLRDIADEAAQLAESQDSGAQLRYWTDLLVGLPDLRLPAPSSEQGRRHGQVGFTVDAAVSARLRVEAGELASTVFLPLLAGYAASLAAVTGQEDFGVGVPLVRRSGPRAMTAVSCLVDVVCLRLPDRLGAVDLRELAQAARPIVEGAFAHQDVPFDQVVAAVSPPRTGRNPLYQTMFACQNVPVRQPVFIGCSVEPLSMAPPAAMHEIVCEVWPLADGGMRVDLSFRADQVAEGLMHRLAGVYEELLVSGKLSDPQIS
ncbi:amino acid adenylation domain-containing protein [Streptomyces sp. NPDC017936]|uniref:amino acid adenylation domain-containing protein n=1 Tax=Streptomyces sp. NPDC017936 TaxID=3365016 RepID=UPI003788880A